MNRNKKEKDQEKEAKKVNRRQFMTTVGNSALGLTVVGSLGVTYDFLSPKVLLEIPSRFGVGTLESIAPNTVILDAEHRLFVFRVKQGFFYSVSAVCTHLGCTTQWKASGIPGHPEGVITCPCHGSIFSKTGDVIHGPAPRALDRFKMYLEQDKLVVDTKETVTEEEMILKV
jgi:cytochrome b6-f complex iron-sulfur subunit